MEVQFEHADDDILMVRLTGRMDIAGAAEIEGPLTSQVSTKDFARVVVDLSGVPFLASIGLGLLVRTGQGVERREGRMVLLNPQPLVAKVLTESGVSQRLHVYETMAAATNFLARLPKAGE